jgi:hypothetical protein
MSYRIRESDVAYLINQVKILRQKAGYKTWFEVEYSYGQCNLNLVNDEVEKRSCCLRHVTGGTKFEMYQYLQAACWALQE